MKLTTHLTQRILFAAMLLLTASGFAGGNAKLHPLTHEGPLTNPYESLIIGNGDVSLSAQMFSHQLVLQIGKNDVWDSRSEDKTEDLLLTQDKLIEVDGAADGLYNFDRAHNGNYTGGSKRGPVSKPAGQIIISHPGLSNTNVSGKVDISTGILTVEYSFPKGSLEIEVFVHREKNVIMSKCSSKGTIPWYTITVEKRPDYVDGEMPDPVIQKSEKDNQWTITQTINEAYGVPDFSWHLGCYFEDSYVLPWRYALEQRQNLWSGDATTTIAVAVTTDRDGDGSSLERALKLSNFSGSDWYEVEKATNARGWEKFWAASSIELEDKELEALWYRTMFGFACHLSPTAQAPGLNANVPIYDYACMERKLYMESQCAKMVLPRHGDKPPGVVRYICQSYRPTHSGV